MDDGDTARRVLNVATPMEANRLGREVKNFEVDRWRGMVDDVAEQCSWLKFSQVEECRTALLGTGDKVLAEASQVDRNWVIGLAGDQADGREPESGRNLLGHALMRVRERLRGEGNV